MKNILLILILLTSIVCFADSAEQQATQPAVTTDISSYNGCTTYDDCLKNGLKERADGVKSVLMFYTNSNKDVKYNLFNNLSVKLAANLCPPAVSVYKNVNNINFMMDVFSRQVSSECSVYYSNITGDGKNRDSVVGQLEVYFCNKDELNETCDNAIVYSRMNNFKQDEQKKQNGSLNNQQNIPGAAGVPMMYMQNGTPVNSDSNQVK